MGVGGIGVGVGVAAGEGVLVGAGVSVGSGLSSHAISDDSASRQNIPA